MSLPSVTTERLREEAETIMAETTHKDEQIALVVTR